MDLVNMNTQTHTHSCISKTHSKRKENAAKNSKQQKEKNEEQQEEKAQKEAPLRLPDSHLHTHTHTYSHGYEGFFFLLVTFPTCHEGYVLLIPFCAVQLSSLFLWK